MVPPFETTCCPLTVIEMGPPPDEDEQPQFICLDQFLKKCGVETGGQAKMLIQGGEVLVNGEGENAIGSILEEVRALTG